MNKRQWAGGSLRLQSPKSGLVRSSATCKLNAHFSGAGSATLSPRVDSRAGQNLMRAIEERYQCKGRRDLLSCNNFIRLRMVLDVDEDVFINIHSSHSGSLALVWPLVPVKEVEKAWPCSNLRSHAKS